ncbi:uncharacterized protein LOC115096351 isoform X2 [Rhinatrema bivittatum]|uniref:uncharacterized protein LOC115096351 isoform X2 n=1 Tax=Rhinatrema bivittatum TaxID=194408 RepID=UPI00112CA0A7|nr:uncharacterized protein LOC115096351 isoform X2 [Rhinatrema bivittatum]
MLSSPLSLLLSPDPCQVLQAVDSLVTALEQDREQLLRDLLGSAERSQYLSALCGFLTAPDIRLCSNVAYILGTIAENEMGASCLVVLAKRQSVADWHLLGTLGAMLKWEDSEAVMNAAGTLGSLVETSAGRQWLLNEPQRDEIISDITTLLDSADEWTANNAALVLARIAMCQEGCQMLLGHPKAGNTLRKLIQSLGVDEAGCGLNAAFALGRLCSIDTGLKQILSFPEATNMIIALESMMANGDAGGSRNACFALSCLAADKDGHEHVIRSPVFTQTLSTLCRLLQSEEQDSSWFAAVTVKVLASQPKGVVKLRDHPELESLLKKVAASKTAGKELLEEVTVALQKLQRLPRPPAPEAKVLDSASIWLGWEEWKPDSGLQVTYRLYEGDILLYKGFQCTYVLFNTKPGREYHFKLALETEGDRSPYSNITKVTLEESVPSCPLDFQVLGRTTTLMKLSWAPPTEPNGIIKYYILFRGDTFLDSTSELSYIVSGLSPSTSYTFSVCACTKKGKGKKASLVAKTADTGDHTPGKLTLYVVGRSEIFITWNVPKAPLGRFFNYELCLNGKVVYLGTERSYTARRLTANTEYTCTVSAITSEGRCESKPVTKRTAKDEYENINKGYYFPAWNRLSDTTSTTNKTPNTSEKSERSGSQVGPPKHSLSKPLKALLSKRTSKSECNTNPAPRSRRNSMLSWSTESSEEAAPSLVPLSETIANHPLRSLTLYKLSNPGTTVHPTSLSLTPRKPHNIARASEENCQSLPILENLTSEYLVQQRANTESELLQEPPKGKKEKIHGWKTLHHICSQILLDKGQNLTPQKTVELRKGFSMRLSRQNLISRNRRAASKQESGEHWQDSELRISGCGDMKFVPMQEAAPIINVPRSLLLKERFFSQARASFPGQLQAWTDLHRNLSQTPLQQREERSLKGKHAPRNRRFGFYDMKPDYASGQYCCNLQAIGRDRQCSHMAARLSTILKD